MKRRSFFGTVFGGLAVALGFKAAPAVRSGRNALVMPEWILRETARAWEAHPPFGLAALTRTYPLSGARVGDTICVKLPKRFTA